MLYIQGRYVSTDFFNVIEITLEEAECMIFGSEPLVIVL